MSKDILLSLPESTDLSYSEDEDSLYVKLTALGCEWPSFPAVGTRAQGGKALLLLRIPAGVRKGELLQVLVSVGISPKVMAIKDARVTITPAVGKALEKREFKVEQKPARSKLVDHFPDVTTSKEDGSIDTTRRPLTTEKLYIGTYLGSEPIEI